MNGLWRELGATDLVQSCGPELAEGGITKVTFKFSPNLKFLSELGDPYDILMLDQNGRAAIDLGLYGVPETYFIDSKGKIKYRQVGPLTVKKFENILKSLKVN